MYFVYVLRCVGSSLYCGWTTDVANRIKAHTGEIPGGAKYTRGHPPVRAEAVWSAVSKESAMRLESFIKKLKKTEKERLIIDPDCFSELFEGRLDISDFKREPEFEKDIAEVSRGNMESVARVPQDK